MQLHAAPAVRESVVLRCVTCLSLSLSLCVRFASLTAVVAARPSVRETVARLFRFVNELLPIGEQLVHISRARSLSLLVGSSV